MSKSTTTPRDILRGIFNRITADQKKLIHNWCKSVNEVSLPVWVSVESRNVANGSDVSTEFKLFSVETDKAIESDNWTYFDPKNHNPSEGQAISTTPQKSDEDIEEPEPINTSEESPIPEQDGRAVPANRVTEHLEDEEEEAIPESDEEPSEEPQDSEEAQMNQPDEVPTVPVAPPTASADPFAGLIDAITNQVLEKLNNKKTEHISLEVVDQHLMNGGFPVSRVVELLDDRQVDFIVAILQSQPVSVVKRAVDKYNEARIS